MSRLRIRLGVLPDDLYIEPEPWPRIGRPPKHDVPSWTVTDDWPNPGRWGVGQVHRILTRTTYVGQRVEVANRKVRIMGSKTNLLQMLTAVAGVKPATSGVRSSEVAEGAGFEPAIRVTVCTLSKRVP